MMPESVHSPEHSALMARVQALEEQLALKSTFLAELKRQYIDLLNEITPTAGEAVRKTNFNLEQRYRVFLGSMDPQGKNNMTRGLRFLCSTHMQEGSE